MADVRRHGAREHGRRHPASSHPHKPSASHSRADHMAARARRAGESSQPRRGTRQQRRGGARGAWRRGGAAARSFTHLRSLARDWPPAGASLPSPLPCPPSPLVASHITPTRSRNRREIRDSPPLNRRTWSLTRCSSPHGHRRRCSSAHHHPARRAGSD